MRIDFDQQRRSARGRSAARAHRRLGLAAHEHVLAARVATGRWPRPAVSGTAGCSGGIGYMGILAPVPWPQPRQERPATSGKLVIAAANIVGGIGVVGAWKLPVW